MERPSHGLFMKQQPEALKTSGRPGRSLLPLPVVLGGFAAHVGEESVHAGLTGAGQGSECCSVKPCGDLVAQSHRR